MSYTIQTGVSVLVKTEQLLKKTEGTMETITLSMQVLKASNPALRQEEGKSP